VDLIPTILANNVFMIARKAPKEQRLCLPANHCAIALALHNDKDAQPVPRVCGRVLLAKVDMPQGLRSEMSDSFFSFHSYSLHEFGNHLLSVKDSHLVNFDFVVAQHAALRDEIPPVLELAPEVSRGNAITYLRVMCDELTNNTYSVTLETFTRTSCLYLDLPCSYRSVRSQLAGFLYWRDFGLDSDWKEPSGNTPICSREGWEVGLLDTLLGDDIIMLARKPRRGDDKCLRMNHFATQVLHPKHHSYVYFVNGCIILAKASRSFDSAKRWTASRSKYIMQSLEIGEFCAAFEKLPMGLRSTYSLVLPNTEVLVDGFVAPKMCAAMPSESEGDEWELVDQVDAAQASL